MSTSKSPRGRGRPKRDASLELRSQVLLELLKRDPRSREEQIMLYQELADKYEVTVRSVRAILANLATLSGKLHFTQTGVKIGSNSYYRANLAVAQSAKEAIADKLVDIISPNISLACSCGTTVARCVRRLYEEREFHTIVTNNCGVVDEVREFEVQKMIMLTGGQYSSQIHGLVGETAEEAFKNESCEAALIGVSGINKKGVLYVCHAEEIPALKQVVESAVSEVYIVADIRKLLQGDTWRFSTIDKLADGKRTQEFGVKVITTSPETLEETVREQACGVLRAIEKMGGVEVHIADGGA